MELQCYLNTFKGYLECDEEGMNISVTSVSFLSDGVEEVFAAAGESVSLTCRNISSLSSGGPIRWAVNKTPGTYKLPASHQTEDLDLDGDSPLVISKLSPSHAGNYQCSESTGQKNVLNRIWLHTLDVTEKSVPGDKNVTFTCVLTCAEECDDFNLTWSGANQEGRQGRLMSVNNTVMKELILPVGPTSSDEITCSVYREGALTVSKTWHPVNSLQTLAWLGLPLGLLITVGGLYLYMKRKHNRNTAKEPTDIGMTHVYDVIQDEEPENQRRFEREAATKIDGFYDLLQAVN
ncbi:uncharacterized protein LOC133440609 [Cololabis saira]|uniref:uncharacterized protein LOC133440609 n=1 Tax=Cololabis saira TaxID=129043 RepID=UPI002AD1EF6B|nr:uncharacterized protein LOC133440609 [Cololabis saira]